MSNPVDDLRHAVGSVVDPELRRTLGELGMITGVALDNGRASIDVALTIAGCPAANRIESDVYAAAANLPFVSEVVVTLGVMTPDQRAAMLANLRPDGAKRNPFTPDSLTRVIAVTSGKGGVGKSTLTTNLACALSAAGYAVGILDADVHGYSIPALMGLAPEGIPVRPTRLDDMIVPPVAHDIKVISIGMFVDDQSTAIAWRGPMLQRTIEQFLTDVYFGSLDFLLLDLPPGTGDVAITVGQLLPHSEVLIVTTPQAASAGVAIRAGMLAQQTGQRILGVVENMTAGEVDGAWLDLFGTGGADAVASGLTALGVNDGSTVDVLGRIPLSVDLRRGGDAGEPLLARVETTQIEPSPASRAITALADRIATSGPSRRGRSMSLLNRTA